MKKIFGISLVSILTALPMLAGAEVVAGDPGATTSSAAAASATPKYALKNSADTDTNAATAGYVKGAYNAIIKGINATQGEIDTINTNIGTYENTVSHLLDNTATRAGTVATINAATSTEQIANSSVNISGVTTSSISATASGDVNLSVPVMDNWATDGEATNPVQTTTSFSGLAVNGLAMSAPGTNNTASVTKSGISGTVNVAGYIATASASSPNLMSLIGNEFGSDYGQIDHSGNFDNDGTNATQAGLGISGADTWGVIYDNGKGKTTGKAVCSTQSGTGFWSEPAANTPADVTTSQNITADFTNGQYCWCQLDSYTPLNGQSQSLAAPWVFYDDGRSASKCARTCANSCALFLGDDIAVDFRNAVFNSVQ